MKRGVVREAHEVRVCMCGSAGCVHAVMSQVGFHISRFEARIDTLNYVKKSRVDAHVYIALAFML